MLVGMNKIGIEYDAVDENLLYGLLSTEYLLDEQSQQKKNGLFGSSCCFSS